MSDRHRPAIPQGQLMSASMGGWQCSLRVVVNVSWLVRAPEYVKSMKILIFILIIERFFTLLPSVTCVSKCPTDTCIPFRVTLGLLCPFNCGSARVLAAEPKVENNRDKLAGAGLLLVTVGPPPPCVSQANVLTFCSVGVTSLVASSFT